MINCFAFAQHRRCDFVAIDACKFICTSIYRYKMSSIALQKQNSKPFRPNIAISPELCWLKF